MRNWGIQGLRTYHESTKARKRANLITGGNFPKPLFVALTVFALAISVMSITAITGTIAFVFDVLIGQSFVSSFGQSGYAISPVSFEDPIAAVGSIDIDTIQLPPELIQDVRLTIEGRAAIAEFI